MIPMRRPGGRNEGRHEGGGARPTRERTINLVGSCRVPCEVFCSRHDLHPVSIASALLSVSAERRGRAVLGGEGRVGRQGPELGVSIG
ncbi:hypothetical protein E2C01_079817 [Portunus trituberculatus]|uniref:Uncharacterized protein n=1 Tax=Portunus trituberculatus TaxID=210409 RepID=A0A5B7IKI5_PORTR|nr:hypothetical protein [Portunus trituberculatus]